MREQLDGPAHDPVLHAHPLDPRDQPSEPGRARQPYQLLCALAGRPDDHSARQQLRNTFGRSRITDHFGEQPPAIEDLVAGL